jgi:hypothetical protein
MKTWFSELFSFLIGRRSTHPIYQREMAGWSYVSAWRRIRRGCIPLIALLFITTTCLCGGSCGLTVLPEVQTSQDWGIVVGIVVLIGSLVGLFVAEGLLNFITGLLATALASTVVSAEIEAQTFGLLRLTSIPPRDIVFAKFSAAFAQVRVPMIVLVLARALIALIATLGGMTLFAVGVLASDSIIPPGTLSNGPVTGILLIYYGLAVIAVATAVLTWLAYYIFRPVLDILLLVALGIFASSLARTRAGGLLAAGGMRLVLWMVSYVVGQVTSSMLSLIVMPMFALAGVPTWVQQTSASPGLFIFLSAIGVVVGVISSITFEAAAIAGLLYFTAQRAKNLPALG